MEGWSVERLHPDHRQALRETEVLYDSRTEHQRLRVFENPTFGRVLTLDGVVQVTERDNFIYHEMLTHVPILAHGAARRVLIVGGGDGGMAREALRHPAVERVTMVEIDAGVVEFSRRYLPMISDGAFDDPRLELRDRRRRRLHARRGRSLRRDRSRLHRPRGARRGALHRHVLRSRRPPAGGGRHPRHSERRAVPAGRRADGHDARLPGPVRGLELLSGDGADLRRRADGVRMGHRRRRAADDGRGPRTRDTRRRTSRRATTPPRSTRPPSPCPATSQRSCPRRWNRVGKRRPRDGRGVVARVRSARRPPREPAPASKGAPGPLRRDRPPACA